MWRRHDIKRCMLVIDGWTLFLLEGRYVFHDKQASVCAIHERAIREQTEIAFLLDASQKWMVQGFLRTKRGASRSYLLAIPKNVFDCST